MIPCVLITFLSFFRSYITHIYIYIHNIIEKKVKTLISTSYKTMYISSQVMLQHFTNVNVELLDKQLKICNCKLECFHY
jgi:hypothetical protein